MTHYVQQKIVFVEKPITAWALLTVIVGLAFTYAYFVNGGISNIVASKDLEEQISAVTSSVGTLESQYLVAKSGISLEYAQSLGYKEAKSATVYVAKKSLGSLSFNR
jgi:hypothetical protein